MSLAVVASAQTAVHAAGLADVTVDFLSDGRCAVAAKGEGFRSSATYRPDIERPEGESRCAMPPVPEDRTVALTVSLPSGAGKPGRSTPSLSWEEIGGRWVGRASLTSWPEAIVVGPASQAPRALMFLAVGLLAVASGSVWRRSRRGHTSFAG